jgi:hypothetical protein
MVVPTRLGTTHMVGRVFDINPLVGKWETVTGDGGFGVREVDLGMVGGEREQVVQRIIMKYRSFGCV